MTTAQKKLDELLRRSGGGKRAAEQTGVSIRTLRDLRGGARPRASTVAALATIGITASDWRIDDEPLDLEALESGEPGDASDLLPRLEALYSDRELAISERIRAASIALSLARRMPARAPIDRLEALARDLRAIDPTLRDLCHRHIQSARSIPENPAVRILAWAHDVARAPDTADRAVTLAHALEARAQRVSSELGRSSDDGLAELAKDVVEARGPISTELVAVLAKYGQESRPLAPGFYNVNGHGYLARCAKNGWRPRISNPPWILGPNGLVCSE